MNDQIGDWTRTAMSDAIREWRLQFRGDAPVKDDIAITDADISNSNLILWGDPRSNRLFRAHCAQTPPPLGPLQIHRRRHHLFISRPGPNPHLPEPPQFKTLCRPQQRLHFRRRSLHQQRPANPQTPGLRRPQFQHGRSRSSGLFRRRLAVRQISLKHPIDAPMTINTYRDLINTPLQRASAGWDTARNGYQLFTVFFTATPRLLLNRLRT